MVAALKNLPPELFTSFLLIAAALFFYLGYLLGKGLGYLKRRREQKSLLREEEKVRRGIKKLLDEEKDGLLERCQEQALRLKHFERQLENYRLKLAGLEVHFSPLFWLKDKKRAQLLYSLLLENETLTQLLGVKTNLLPPKDAEELYAKLVSLKKRQQLLSGIFSDPRLKNYVQDALFRETSVLHAKKINSPREGEKKE